jgi:hypothetical protein
VDCYEPELHCYYFLDFIHRHVSPKMLRFQMSFVSRHGECNLEGPFE